MATPEPSLPTDIVEDYPDPEVLDLCSRFAREIKEYVIETDDWFRFQSIDYVRIRIQYILLQVAEEVMLHDRKTEGPSFIEPIAEQKISVPEPYKRRPAPLYKQLQSLRSRLNGHGWESNGRQ